MYARRLEQNLSALATVQPDFGRRVTTAGNQADLVSQIARDGSASLIIQERSPQRIYQIHSRYRPIEEAQRVVDTLGDAATLVVFGMGAMFVPSEYIRRFPAATVIVVARDVETVRTVLQYIDLSKEFASRRLYIAVGEAALISIVSQFHQPAIRDGLTVYHLRSWTSRAENERYFRYMQDVLTRCMKDIAGEHHTIRRYGRPWFTHTVENTLTLNLQNAGDTIRRTGDILRSRPNRILAAGPSLDIYLDTAKNVGSDSEINDIAVDTALPAIAGRRRTYTGVVTIDPQGWSPLHFRSLRTRSPIIWGDLGITPSIPSHGELFIPLGSAHPLHTLLHTHGFPMVMVPGSQNVTETAARLVSRLGGTIAEIRGADFSYPRAKSYARGTYHYTLADLSASRLHPGESFFADQVYPQTTSHASGSPDEVLVFEKQGMALQKRRITDLLSNQSTAVPTDTTGIPIDIREMWRNHAEELELVKRTTTGLTDTATPEILRVLGEHGRAHLPLLPSCTDPAHELDQRFMELFEKVRGFIFSRLSRY